MAFILVAYLTPFYLDKFTKNQLGLALLFLNLIGATIIHMAKETKVTDK